MRKPAFSLIEILVVVVIIAILATISALSFTSRQADSKIAAAEFELGQLKRLIVHLESQTSFSPGGIPVRPCISNTQVQLQGCDAGISCNDGRFGADWDGPYGDVANFLDPWNNDYWFNANYSCNEGANNPAACDNFDGQTIRAITSAGPDGLPQTPGTPADGADDILLVMCTT